MWSEFTISLPMKKEKEIDVRNRIRTMHPDALCFGDDYFLFDVTMTPLPEYSSKIETYGFFLCLSGTACGDIDLMPFRLQPGMMMITIPGQLITHHSSSEDFSGTSLVMTQRFVDNLGLPYNFGLAIGIRETPVLTLKPGELAAIRNYCNMVRGLLEKERPYQAETLRHLTCAYAYSLGAYLYQMAENRRLSGDEALMQRFLAEVRTHYKYERHVIYYAERLHITAGYLSTLVQRISGKSPSEWINDFVITEAKVLLKSSNLTIQQIGDELSFPSQSFFGKYFKRQTGMSPKEYRIQGPF